MADVVVNDGVWKKLVAKVNGIAKAHARVGVLASASEGDTYESGIGIIELAAIHEFGSEAAGIPQRSFIRRTFEVKASEFNTICARMAKLLLTERVTLEKAVSLLGLWGASEVKKTIIDGIPPPNAPSTIARKGSSTPLIDSGRLVGAVTFEVVL